VVVSQKATIGEKLILVFLFVLVRCSDAFVTTLGSGWGVIGLEGNQSYFAF